jgi:serpin B
MKRLAVLVCLAPILAVPATGTAPPDAGVPDDVRTLVQGNSTFALDLYARLRNKEGNLFFSPYSISTALAMTYAGARGETAEQMAKVLHFSLDPQRLHPAFAELTRELNAGAVPRGYQLSIAQSLWGDNTLSVRPEFDNLLQADYGARLGLVDFRLHPDAARQQINQWVAERTNDKIKELLGKNDIDARTRMMLVNAVYFKAAWLKEFNADLTQKGAVFHTAGKQVKAALMSQTAVYPYAEDEGLQALELPYKGREVSMVVLLPREKDGVGKLEQSLTAGRLDAWLGKLKSRRVAVELPRFKLQVGYGLSKALEAMGMPLAFSTRADFSGISTAQTLMISRVIHQTFVDVNEKGTEAAAATAVGLKLPAPRPEKPVVFRADHPFLFLLRENRIGSILFLGRLADPSAGAETGKE